MNAFDWVSDGMLSSSGRCKENYTSRKAFVFQIAAWLLEPRLGARCPYRLL